MQTSPPLPSFPSKGAIFGLSTIGLEKFKSEYIAHLDQIALLYGRRTLSSGFAGVPSDLFVFFHQIGNPVDPADAIVAKIHLAAAKRVEHELVKKISEVNIKLAERTGKPLTKIQKQHLREVAEGVRSAFQFYKSTQCHQLHLAFLNLYQPLFARQIEATLEAVEVAH